MARQRRSAAERAEPGRHIEATTLYTRYEAVRLLRMSEARFGDEVRVGRLRCRLDGKRQLFLGRWLLDWLELPAVQPRAETVEA